MVTAKAQLFGPRPDLFAEEVLGVTLYPHQREPLMAVARGLQGEGKRRVAVKSCNSVGKDFMAALATLWLPSVLDDVRVVTTGPTFDQLRDVVWKREIHRLYADSKLKLPGRMLDTEWDISPTRTALARSVNTKESLSGRHAAVILVIVDEASAIELAPDIWEAIDTLLSSGIGLLLAIGNPTRSSGDFYDMFNDQAAENELFTISAYDTPNLQACHALGAHQIPAECVIVQPGLITHEWVEEVKARYGEDSDFFRVHVLGEFPEAGGNALIKRSWIEAAVIRKRWSAGSRAPEAAGLDIARHGHDMSAIAVLCDQDLIALDEWHDDSLMGTVGRTLKFIEAFNIRVIAVDDTNMHGVTDRLVEVAIEENLDLTVLPINWSSHADDQRAYHNKPSEMWGRIRDNLSPEAPQPLSLAIGNTDLLQRLVGQLAQPTYKFDSYGMGRLWVEKMGDEHAKSSEQRIQSPDLGDALALALEAWVQYYGTIRRTERTVYEDSFLGRR
ncbi:MAG: hypothetical protein IID41_06855 [Planctomycetes bacterium]|nr:hypothetical protein [Planctomycetota bacterium]